MTEGFISNKVCFKEREKKVNKIRKRNTIQHFEENTVSERERNVKAQFQIQNGILWGGGQVTDSWIRPAGTNSFNESGLPYVKYVNN